MEYHRCSGTTQAGKRCRRQTASLTGRCWQHIQQVKAARAIWAEKGYPTPSHHVDARHRRLLTTKLKHGPAKTDDAGHIYIFQLSSDPKGCGYFKIGRTTQPVKTRLRQWSDKAVLVKSFPVVNNKFCERVIHLYLDAWRVYRYRVKSEAAYCSVWKKDGKPVTKADKAMMESHKLQGRKKEIEWFQLDKEYMLSIVERVAVKNQNGQGA